MDEMVLVVKDKDVQNIVEGYGFLYIPLDTVKNLVEKRGFFVRRSKAETDNSIRQLIPYVVIKNPEGMYLLVKRLKTQTESRLHGFYSVGIGGHINDRDEGDSPWMKFLSGMEREINEEVSISQYNWPQYVGIIRENTTSVNKVHLGVVFTITAVIKGIREHDKFLWELRSIEELKEKYEKMETWSCLALDGIQSLQNKNK